MLKKYVIQNLLHSYSNQNAVYWHKDRYADQLNRTESPGVSPYIYGQMTPKGSKVQNNSMGKEHSSTMVLRKLDIHIQNNEDGLYKNELKDLNLRTKTIELSGKKKTEENHEIEQQ